MKKSILALSAAVAVSGLGFAGAANALAVFGQGTVAPNHVSNADGLVLTASGVGHYLFAPYFTTQGDNNTLVSVVNTDTVNGKAVKVRFRGAANSDDVLDFTLFLSPGDVWTGSLIQGADATSHLSTQDTSCTLPANIKDQPFLTGRLDQSLSDDALAAHTREGYVEFLNMADIPPTVGGVTNPLYKNIKHVSGKAPCDMAGFADVLSDQLVDVATAQSKGLYAPTGGLTGGWVIVRMSNISTYSGLLTSVAAVDMASLTSATGRLAFAPQSTSAITTGPGLNVISDVSADPLFLAGKIEPLWMDLPDMSTPLLSVLTAASPALDQAETLSAALAKGTIGNEFVSTAAGASVPGDTDWVISQPTRRYLMAYDYSAAANVDGRVFSNTIITNPYSTGTTQVVKNRTLNSINFGNFICLRGTFRGTDREEGALDQSVSFSPAPAAAAYCGEVFTLSFNRDKSEVLSAGLTNQKVSIAINGNQPEAGWATFTPNAVVGSRGVPMLGFAATSLLNREQQGNYGYTYAHRW